MSRKCTVHMSAPLLSVLKGSTKISARLADVAETYEAIIKDQGIRKKFTGPEIEWLEQNADLLVKEHPYMISNLFAMPGQIKRKCEQFDVAQGAAFIELMRDMAFGGR